MKLLINPTTFINLNILYLCIFLYIAHASKNFVIHKSFPYFRYYFRICLSKESHIALQDYIILFIKYTIKLFNL